MAQSNILLVLGLAMLGMEPAEGGPIGFGVNLIVNGDAEAGPGNTTGAEVTPVPGWQYNAAPIAVVQYGAGGAGQFPAATDPGGAVGGLNFFAGGPQQFGGLYQLLDVSSLASAMDTGGVGYEISGYFGGWTTQDDYGQLRVSFFDAGDNEFELLRKLVLGPSASERGNQTGLFFQSGSGMMPAGTRTIRFFLDFYRVAGDYNDGYLDNLSFVARAPAVVPEETVPEPGTAVLLAGGVAGLAIWRRRGMVG